MHPPNPHPSTAPLPVGRSLGATLAASLLTVIAFAAAFVTATTVAAVVAGPPLVTAGIALAVGFATALAVPIGTARLGRRLLDSLRRRGRRPTLADPDRPDPRPAKG